MEKEDQEHKKIIHMEFDMDDDVEEQPKNANDVKSEGKVRVRKMTVHYYEFSSEDKEGEHANPKKLRKPKITTKIQVKLMKKIRLSSPMK